MVNEISAAQLDAACRKCMRLEVSDTAVLARILEEQGVEYTVLSETKADVFAKVNITQLALALSGENCEIRSLQERDESLESYFVALVGGETRE